MDLLPATLFSPAPSPAVEAGASASDLIARNAKPARPPRPAPETLHPSLWLGHQLGRQADQAVPTGFAPLDAQLPGSGWPRRALSELLLPHPGVGEIRLLSPSLVATQQAGRLVMLFDPPAALSAGALVQLGLDVEQLLIINTAPPTDGARCEKDARVRVTGDARVRVTGDARVRMTGDARLWALEQALKSGHVGAVVAWLPPRLRAERLRRLQVAAQAHDGPAFMLRELAAAQRPTAASLRLALQAGGADVLSVRLLKRRGPPLEQSLRLALPPVLCGAAARRSQPGRVQAPAANPRSSPMTSPTSGLRIGQGAERLFAEVKEAAAVPLRAATFVNLAEHF